MKNFRGDTSWIHRWEGHAGRAYWPKGNSGVTLDPGVDLGHIDAKLFERAYAGLLNDAQQVDARKVMGLKGEAAGAALEAAKRDNTPLATIRVSREQADPLFAIVAEPYWEQITARFKSLLGAKVPAAVHTAMLSLTYNRGSGNKVLEQLRDPLDKGDWAGVGRRIQAMQQDHKLEGIRKRRRAEGQLILDNL